MTRREQLFAALMVLMFATTIGLACFVAFHDPVIIRARAFELFDEHGNRQAVLGTSPQGVATLTFFDEQGRARSSIGVLKDGRPVSMLRDENGNVLWAAP